MHDDEHNIPVSQRSRQEEDPLRHIRNGGILLLVGIVLRLQSQFHHVQRLWMLLDDGRHRRGTHPGIGAGRRV